jgi:hypothetical protein
MSGMVRLLLGRAWLDAQCFLRGHRYVRGDHDLGAGYCTRCGRGDHVWQPIPERGMCVCQTCLSEMLHHGWRLVPPDGA